MARARARTMHLHATTLQQAPPCDPTICCAPCTALQVSSAWLATAPGPPAPNTQHPRLRPRAPTCRMWRVAPPAEGRLLPTARHVSVTGTTSFIVTLSSMLAGDAAAGWAWLWRAAGLCWAAEGEPSGSRPAGADRPSVPGDPGVPAGTGHRPALRLRSPSMADPPV
jgi:hypothetical protein